MNNLNPKQVVSLLALGTAMLLASACSLSPQPEPPAATGLTGEDNLGGATGGGPLGAGGEVAVDSSADAGVPAIPPAPGAREEDAGVSGDAGDASAEVLIP